MAGGAMGRPRQVMTISLPAAARLRYSVTGSVHFTGSVCGGGRSILTFNSRTDALTNLNVTSSAIFQNRPGGDAMILSGSQVR
jgi:hypothetical protein